LSGTNKTVLSIAIPVFNEAGQIGQTIRSLQLLKDGRIEFLVSDNSSSDHTLKEVVHAAEEFLPNLIVFSQNENLGFRGNLRFLAEHTTGEFIWFLGAGETVHNFDVDSLLHILTNSRGVKNFVLTGALASSWRADVWDEVRLSSTTDRKPFSEAISLNILHRKSALTAWKDEGIPSSGDFWPHVEAILAMRSFPESTTIFVDSPILVSIAENETGWWYHDKDVWSIYLSQVRVILDSVEFFGTDGWEESILNLQRGVQFLFMAIEVRKSGGIFPLQDVPEARRLGIRKTLIAAALLLNLVPRCLLSSAIRMFRLGGRAVSKARLITNAGD
jgi:glycosyltransferase involved in cell wall biosynthesis